MKHRKKWICSLIDFQQNLPVPTIKTGDMFYSRMLWTYNVGIYDASTTDGIMYLWDETESRRGSSGVITSLQQTIKGRHRSAQRLILMSDSCCGQNKNKATMCFLCSVTRSDGLYQRVDHMYKTRGHTYLPNDRQIVPTEQPKWKNYSDAPRGLRANHRGSTNFSTIYNKTNV